MCEPDILALQTSKPTGVDGVPPLSPLAEGLIAVAMAPPRPRFSARAAAGRYLTKSSTLVIRHHSDDRIVALIEIVSPGNKSSRGELERFVEKSQGALEQGFHLLIVDLFPPGSRDPQGIHGLIWERYGADSFVLPPGEPLTQVSYMAGSVIETFVEPTAVGRTLLEMPLFLEEGYYINVPLEETYMSSFLTMPSRLRQVLES